MSFGSVSSPNPNDSTRNRRTGGTAINVTIRTTYTFHPNSCTIHPIDGTSSRAYCGNREANHYIVRCTNHSFPIR
jgi:hypothetical protein